MNISKENKNLRRNQQKGFFKIEGAIFQLSLVHVEADLISLLAPADAFRCPNDAGWMLAPETWLVGWHCFQAVWYDRRILGFISDSSNDISMLLCVLVFGSYHPESLSFKRRFCMFSLSWRLCSAQGLCERSEMRLPRRLRWWGHAHKSFLTSRLLHLALLIRMYGPSLC